MSKSLLARKTCLVVVLSVVFWTVQAPPQTVTRALATDLDVAQTRARDLKQPLMLLVAESGASRVDDRARAVVDSLTRDNVVVLSLDLSISRNRATVARFHVTNTPVLLCLSSRGIIISREEGALTKSLLRQRFETAEREGSSLDTKLDNLKSEAAANTNDFAAQFRLTDFFLAQGNALEATPYLAAVAHSDAFPAPARMRAWVALARAHLWIGENEKCRHEAEDMISKLGNSLPESRAAGMLVIGTEDIVVHPALAPAELQQAVAAAPESAMGREAAAALANLQKSQNNAKRHD